MRPPALSVLLPVYNAAAYLVPALDSILNQTFSDFECIVVDDGSVDRSARIVADFAARDSRFRLISQANQGISVALNRALAESRAPMLARMDGDDICLPERFERQLGFMVANPEHVLLGTAALVVDEDDDPIEPLATSFGEAALNADLLEGKAASICHPTIMMRAQALHDIGGYRPEAEGAEDLDVYLRLAEVGRIENLPQTLLRFRRHPTSVTATTSAYDGLTLRQRVTSEARQRRGLSPLSLKASSVWQPANRDEERLTLAVIAFKSGYSRTGRKYLSQLLMRPAGPLVLARILAFRLGPHMARKLLGRPGQDRPGQDQL